MKFLQILKNIFSNVCLVFKNFFHWTFSRIIILIFSFFLAIISFLPFLLLAIILGFVDVIDWSNTFISFSEGTQFFGLLSAFGTSPFFFLLESLIIILGIAFAIGVFGYKSVLVYRLIDSYDAGERIKLRENFYIGFLRKYIGMFLKIFFYLALPVIGYVIYFFAIVLLFGGFENILYIVQGGVINAVSILLLLGFLISFFSFIYIYYRLIFSYINLVKYPELSGKELLSKSRITTRGTTIFFLLGAVIIYGIATFSTGSYESYAKDSSNNIGKYLFYRSLENVPESVSFESLGLTSYKNYEELQSTTGFIDLDTQYGSDSLESLNVKKMRFDLTSNILSVFNFLVFYAMFELIIFSVYQTTQKEKKPKKSLLEKFKSKLFKGEL